VSPHSPDTSIDLFVLGSGSRGNVSVLRLRFGGEERLVLIDLGLSPRRVGKRLESLGLRADRVAGAVLTHLDRDHCHEGWARADGLPPEGVLVHWAHARRAERLGGCGLVEGKFRTFADPASVLDTPAGPLTVSAVMCAHDDQGVAVLRFGWQGLSLGYATDVGCVTEEVVEHLDRVGTLAIESNYCPEMQAASERPEFLKRRITGGHGHLSNQESARAVGLIRPEGDVVLLHLSSECNRPERAISAHAGHGRRVIVSGQDEPSGPVAVAASGRTGRGEVVVKPGAAQMGAAQMVMW
jgi:phosphoribosyl 1,2-cyclic phosphodiesterase